MPIRDEFPNEQLLHIHTHIPWFADICIFVVASQFPPEVSQLYKKKLESDAKLCNDQVICMCIPDIEVKSVLQFCQLRQPKNYLTVGFIGPPFSKMPINSSPPVKNARK
ncbi:hypothetical protein CR513_08055, partial [Mucuna pruriens]